MSKCNLCGTEESTEVLIKFKVTEDGIVIPKFAMDVCSACNERHAEYQRTHPDDE